MPTFPELNRKDDLKTYVKQVKQYHQDLVNFARSISKNDCLSIKTDDGRYRLISKDFDPNTWRVTYYDEHGWPTNHCCYNDYSQALNDILVKGAEISEIPAPPASMDSAETILERIRNKQHTKHDVIELITFHRMEYSQIVC